MIKLTDAELLRTQCLIAGVWVSADDDKVFSVRNPTTGDIVASVPNVGSGDYSGS